MEPPPLLQWGHLIIPLLCSTPRAFPTQTPLFFLQSPMRFTFRPPEWWPPIHVSLWLGPYFDCTCHLKCRLLKVFLWKNGLQHSQMITNRRNASFEDKFSGNCQQKREKSQPTPQKSISWFVKYIFNFQKFSSLRHSPPRIITQCSCNKNTQSIFFSMFKMYFKKYFLTWR